MHIHMFLDHYAYVLDALVYDAYICDPWYLSMLHVCMMRQILLRTDGRTDEPTDKAILGVWRVFDHWPWSWSEDLLERLCHSLHNVGVLCKSNCWKNAGSQFMWQFHPPKIKSPTTVHTIFTVWKSFHNLIQTIIQTKFENQADFDKKTGFRGYIALKNAFWIQFQWLELPFLRFRTFT